MRRLWLPFLIAVFLAACSSAPQQVSRGGSPGTASSAWHTRPPGFPHFVDHSIGREEISIQAMGLVGIPYRWGGNTPDSGFDCSGLVKYVLARAASVDLPRTTAEMGDRGQSIDPDEIAAGDLVFFNTTGRPHSHVGIYVGNLRFVNAPSTGGTVRLDYLTNPYWARHFDGIRRMAPPKQTPAPFETPTWEASTPTQRAPAVAAAPVVSTAVHASAADQGRLALATQPLSAAPAYAAVQQIPAAAQADAFEPPPAALGAAQMQARDAGAIAPPAPIATNGMASIAPAAEAQQPDAIDAAADAFEPPPPVAVAAERQAARAGSVSIGPAATPNAPVQIIRASAAGAAQRAPTQTGDDPIARFANSAF